MVIMKEEQEKEFEIPVAGSLGLLALGYRGVQAWRKVRDEAMAKMENNPKKK